MTPEEFRSAAHELVDWLTDRRISIEERRVLPEVKPGDIAAQFPVDPPIGGDDSSAVLADLEQLIAPGITEVQHPMNFGWFPSNASLSSILGDFASSGLSALGISWESAPSLTEVEEVVVDWLRQLTGLGDEWSGVIQDTASTSCLVALIAARERATDHAQTSGGLVGFGRRLHVYTTDEAHSSVRKGALLAGFGAADMRIVDVDPWTRDMDIEHLRALMDADVAAGGVPAAVVALSGSTGVTAFDQLDEVIEASHIHRAWVHVDAAMAGAALLLPEQRHLFDGIDQADSISWNPHKWMGTILDTSLLYLRDPEILIRVMSTNPGYLRSTGGGGEATQFRDWGIPLGRRFRALKLWYQLRVDGPDEIRTRLRRDLDNARWFAAEVAQLDGWEIVAPTRLQTVCVQHRPATVAPDDREALSAHNLAWVRSINSSGNAFLSPSLLDDQWIARISIGVEATERHHLESLLALMEQHAAAVTSQAS
ncbi:MAG: aspartate aminotransferase family protein [Ilumatobacter sp.]